MDNQTEPKILEQINNWCIHCQLEIVKYLLWNADLDWVKEMARLTMDAIYRRATKDKSKLSCVSIYQHISPDYLKEIRDAINEILETKGQTDPFSD